MRVVIEMPAGTQDKAEIDKETGRLVVDRKLLVPCPFNYGFITETLAEDGDALDVFVLGQSVPGLTEIDAAPVGIFYCKDQGVNDHKVLAVPYEQPATQAELEHAVLMISKYLAIYKKGFEVQYYTDNVLATMRVIRRNRLHKQMPVYQHETLGWKRFVSLLVFAGLVALASVVFK